MSEFSVAWLDLRESADNAARDTPPAAQALRWLSAVEAAMPIIVDLGSGTGSTLRALSPVGASPARDYPKNTLPSQPQELPLLPPPPTGSRCSNASARRSAATLPGGSACSPSSIPLPG